MISLPDKAGNLRRPAGEDEHQHFGWAITSQQCRYTAQAEVTLSLCRFFHLFFTSLTGEFTLLFERFQSLTDLHVCHNVSGRLHLIVLNY
jgi:hypothetical protein